MAKRFFALGLSEHRLWGLILTPLILTKKEAESFFSPSYIVFPDEADEGFMELSHTEKEVVRTIDEYSDQKLFRLFSKDKSVKEFQEKVNERKITEFIRPFIEKRIIRVLEMVKGTRTKIFLREKTRSNIFDEDFLKILTLQAEPVFNFQRGTEGSKYSLDLFYDGKRLKIKDQYCDTLTNKPAIIRVNNFIYFVRDIEASKIRPFFNKDFIDIPQKSESAYFKTFALNIIKDYEVNAEGFSIHKIQPEKKALIALEHGLHNNAVITLRFIYGNRKILANSSQKAFVDFHRDKDSFHYDKYSRDSSWEDGFHDLLNDLGLMSYDQVNYEIKGNRSLDLDTQLFNLVEWINTSAAELEVQGLEFSNSIGDRDFYTGGYEMILGSELINDWFDIHAIVKAGEFEIPFYDFRLNILNGKRTFRLPDGKIFIIPNEWFGRFREMFEFGKVEKKKIRIHKQHFFILEKAEKGIRGQDLKNLEILNSKEKLTDTKIPASLTASLRPYQFEGYSWLYYLQQNNLGGCLADDMGLGKTIQAITLLLKNKEESGATQRKEQGLQQMDLFSTTEPEPALTTLIIVPASLVHNWKNELIRFGPSLKIMVYLGNQRSRNLNSFSNFDVIISSYHTIRQDIEILSGFRFHYVILDESQVIKNPSSKVYKAMTMLNSDRRLALTGTPVENSLTDLWAQMNFVNEGLLGNLHFFRREFVMPIEKKNDSTCEERLKKLINPFILRRTKAEVARDLPEITDQVVYCNMSDAQRKFYEEEKSMIRRSIFESIDMQGPDKSAMIILQGLTRLRQAANHPALVDEDYREDSGKFSEILRNIDNIIAENHKVLIFSSFVKHLDLIMKELDDREIRYTVLTGASTNREYIVKAFQDDPECKVFLISLKAGGVGLNLTAADYVFILDPWWNPASEEQAVNRAHRIGQDKNVFVFRFISENSIEEKIQRLQEKKSKLAEAFITSNNPLKNIDREQLEKLFE